MSGRSWPLQAGLTIVAHPQTTRSRSRTADGRALSARARLVTRYHLGERIRRLEPGVSDLAHFRRIVTIHHVRFAPYRTVLASSFADTAICPCPITIARRTTAGRDRQLDPAHPAPSANPPGRSNHPSPGRFGSRRSSRTTRRERLEAQTSHEIWIVRQVWSIRAIGQKVLFERRVRDLYGLVQAGRGGADLAVRARVS